jgi:glutamate racemase
MERHPEIDARCTTGGKCTYLTTENPEAFADLARVFLDEDIEAKHVELN